jgi:hypothetical protein
VLDYMTISDALAEAILETQPTFAASVTEVKTRLATEFGTPEDISTDDLFRVITHVLETKSSKPDRLPLTLVVFDELQQFLGGDTKKADELLSVVEDISARFESRLLFVATGQSEMGATSELQRLQDRFRVRVTLGVTDVETVVRRVVLAKKPEAVAPIQSVIGQVRGEIDRQLGGTAIAPTAADEKDLAVDYPLLPSRRRFWDRVLRGFDTMGRAGQLRTQLRVVHETVKQVADRPLGWVVSGDALFDQLRPNLLETGSLSRELASTIDEVAAEKPDGEMSARVCKLIFLIGKMPTEGLLASGIKADANMLSDLLVEDLTNGSAIRQQVPALLQALAARGVLQLGGDGEFGLQTKEGREWQQAYQSSYINCLADLPRLRDSRVEEFKRVIDSARKDVKIVQGASKEARRVSLHFGDQPPSSTTGEIPIWVRDEWSETEKRVRDDSRAAGVDSATISVFLPKRNADDLISAIASLHARDETLNRPAPTTDGGREARASMQAQALRDRERLNDLLAAVLAEAVVMQGGGTEVAGVDLASKLATAASASAGRLFPNFDIGDHPRWGEILPHIKAGNGDPLQKVGYNGPPQDNPVCKQILSFIANRSEKGAAIRSHFTTSPFGWPRDAVDGGLMALVSAGLLIAKRNGQTVEARSFDTNTVGGADFERESNVVTPDQKFALRALAKDILGVNLRPGEETDGIRRVLDSLKDLAAAAGGEPPLPARPSTDVIDELRQHVGNRQLLEAYAVRDDLRSLHSEWTGRTHLKGERWPHWEQLGALLRFAKSLPLYEEVLPSVNAIRDSRLLLEPTDPTGDLRGKLSVALRSEINRLHGALYDSQTAALTSLEQSAGWTKLTADDRIQVLIDNQITPTPPLELKDDHELLESLEGSSLAEWHDKLAALQSRLNSARLQAARLLEPAAIAIDLPRWTITSPDDLKAFLAEVERVIQERMGDGPIIVN